jgi:hypothetical protein
VTIHLSRIEKTVKKLFNSLETRRYRYVIAETFLYSDVIKICRKYLFIKFTINPILRKGEIEILLNTVHHNINIDVIKICN